MEEGNWDCSVAFQCAKYTMQACFREEWAREEDVSCPKVDLMSKKLNRIYSFERTSDVG